MLWHMIVVYEMLSRGVWLSSRPYIGNQARPRYYIHELTHKEGSLIDIDYYTSNSERRGTHVVKVISGPFAKMERLVGA